MTTQNYLRQLLSLPTVERALMSPDRRWVAFQWYRIQENMDIFVVPADGSQPPVALTHTPEYTDLVSWSADSQSVLVSEDHDRDERTRLFKIDLNLDSNEKLSPGAMLPMTDDRPPYFLRGGALSPDGQILYYGANYDFTNSEVLETTWIYKHDLQTNQRKAIARPQRPALTWPELNLSGTHLIYYRKDRHPAGYQVHLVDVLDAHDTEILNFGDQTKVFAAWLPDSLQILFLAELTAADGVVYRAVGVYHVQDGQVRWLVNDPHRNIESCWASPDGSVIIDEIIMAGHQASMVDLQTGQEFFFPVISGNLLPVGRAAGGQWIASYYSSISPTELVFFDWGPSNADHPELYSLTRVWDHTMLRPEQLYQAQSVQWISYDGLEIQGWLYRCLPNPQRAVIMIHGGPTYHSEDELKPVIQYLVRCGFNVLDVNYRGSTGFSLRFQDAIKEDGWGGREQQDIAAGAESLIRAGLAERGRVGVFGTSYGGYSSWYLITHFPPEIIAAAAPICGMTDLVIDYETTRPDLRPYSEEMMGGNPTQAPERYHHRSPIHYVQDILGKLFIIQGGQDPNVTPANVHQVIKSLDNAGIKYELLVFEDEGHGIVRPDNQRVLYTRLADFFSEALG